METESGENRVMHELAYIYIALAHGTDADLSEEEIDRIATSLRGWESDTAQTVTSALKQALGDYIDDGSSERLDRAVAVVREAFPLNRRRDLMDDLMEIALADDRFLYRESSFIDRVRKGLGVMLDDEMAEGNAWSIIGRPDESNQSWSPVHDLALIYVTLAHRSDADLADEEIEAIAVKLNEWVPELREDEVLRVVQDALSVYVQGPDKRMFTEAVESVGQRIPRHQLSALLSDLTFVAGADGQVLDQEQKLIEQLSRAWSIDEAASPAQS